MGARYGQIWRYITAGARVPRHHPGYAITQVTKISNRHLQALEQEHFDVLPGGVFNKSMVREYARVVGLDQEEWVGRYLTAHKPTGVSQMRTVGSALPKMPVRRGGIRVRNVPISGSAGRALGYCYSW
jgi:hypothetical protein